MKLSIRPGYALLPALAAITALMVSTPAGAAFSKAPRSIVVPENRSIMLHFDHMRRVQVTNPEIADVVVSSLMQLAVYGKQRGLTTLYVWDKAGLHEYEVSVTGLSPAEKVSQQLRGALGSELSYVVVGEDTVLVEGELAGAEMVHRARQIIEARRQGPVKIVDLIRVKGSPQLPAAAAAAALEDIFGDAIGYRILDETTLVVQGDVSDPALAERVARVVETTARADVTILNLVKYNDELASPPLDKIRAAIGGELHVWQVKGRTVAVDGSLTSDDEYARISKILEQFAVEANVINLLRVVKPRPPIADYAQELATAFGPDVDVRQMGPETLSLEGTVTSEEMLDHYRNLLAAMAPPYNVIDYLRIVDPYKDQIELAALVCELSRDDIDRLGVDWGVIGVSDDGAGLIGQPFLIDVNIPGGINFYGDVGATVNALLQDTKSRVLSRPRVVVNDGEQGEILVGGEVPIPIVQPGTAGVTTVSIEYKAYGVRLRFTPVVKTDGKTIDLTILPEVSSLDWTNAVSISGFRVPALRTRRAETVVSIPDSGTLVIGGLLQRDEVVSVQRVPLLSSIPIIGELFKQKSFRQGDTELVILLTPRIVTGTAHGPGFVHPGEQELRDMSRLDD